MGAAVEKYTYVVENRSPIVGYQTQLDVHIFKAVCLFLKYDLTLQSQYFDILNLKLVLETFNGFLSYFLFPCMRVRKYEFLIPKTLYNFHFKYRYSHLKIRQFIAFK